MSFPPKAQARMHRNVSPQQNLYDSTASGIDSAPKITEAPDQSRGPTHVYDGILEDARILPQECSYFSTKHPGRRSDMGLFLREKFHPAAVRVAPAGSLPSPLRIPDHSPRRIQNSLQRKFTVEPDPVARASLNRDRSEKRDPELNGGGRRETPNRSSTPAEPGLPQVPRLARCRARARLRGCAHGEKR